MTCRHAYFRETRWGDYEDQPRSALVRARLIQKRRCRYCREEHEVASQSTRAIRERAAQLRAQPTLLRHDAARLDLLIQAITQAVPSDGAWSATFSKVHKSARGHLTTGNLAEQLTRLAEDGLVTLEKSFPTGGESVIRSLHWEKDQYEGLCEHLGIDRDRRPQAEALAEEIETWIGEVTDAPRGKVFIDIWTAHLALLTSPQAKRHASRRWQRLLQATREIATAYIAERPIAFRQLSIRTTGRSKGLTGDAEDLEDLLGAELESYGVRLHQEMLRLGGPVQVSHSDGFSCTAGQRGMAIPASYADDAEWKTRAGTLLVVENLTCFEQALADPAWRSAIVFWSAGRLGSRRRRTIERLLASGCSDLVAWFDLDPTGLMIAEELRQLAAGHSARWRTHLMDVETYAAAPSRVTMAPWNRAQAKRLAADHGAWYAPLAAAMDRTGEFVEQEALSLRESGSEPLPGL